MPCGICTRIWLVSKLNLIVFVKLTERGERAYHHHADYHRQMTEAILDKLDEKELPVLIKTLDALSEFFNGYSEEPENK